MKVLYIAHYKEGSGWSNASLNSILALDKAGVDVVCRNVSLTNNRSQIPERILQLEEKSIDNVDYCIQHVLPHHLVGSSRFKKNIAVFVSESNMKPSHPWVHNLKIVDEVWVPNNTNKNVLESCGLKNTKVVPYACDINSYTKEHQLLNFGPSNGKYKFYYIGDMNDRKNIDGLIKCYFSEFTQRDQVSLIIKVNRHGVDPENLKTAMNEYIDKIKEQLRIFENKNDYPDVILITSHLNNEAIRSLHKTCDCYVSISHGEGWNIPAFDAMCYGNHPICSNEGGPKDFIDSENIDTGKLIDGLYGVCCHNNPAFSFIFTGNDEWFLPSESLTKKAMREYYETNKQKTSDGLSRGNLYNFENIGNLMKELLDE